MHIEMSRTFGPRKGIRVWHVKAQGFGRCSLHVILGWGGGGKLNPQKSQKGTTELPRTQRAGASDTP